MVEKTRIICEAASSWNGDPNLLKVMIRVAAKNGGDIFKTQDYRAKNVPDFDPDKARYEKYQMLDELYPQFIKWCAEYGIEPLVTCFNKDRVKFLADLGLKKVKLASISLTNIELIMEAGLHFEEIIISTAMHSREEIKEAIDLLASNAKKFTIMHCTANYPLYPKDANLERINELKKMVEGVEGQEYASVGYSNHGLDTDIPKAAIAMGIKYLEVHFSLSRYLPQIKHQMYEAANPTTTHEISLEPRELFELSWWRDKVALMSHDQSSTSRDEEEMIRDKYLGRYGK